LGFNSFAAGYKFKDKNEEIYFFKELKPSICKHLVYYRKIYNVEINRPLSGDEEQTVYLKNELENIQKYMVKRLDFYRYYRQGASHLDKFYFTRNQNNPELQYLESFHCERDTGFSTNADFIVTMILANDMLQEYLTEEIRKIWDKHGPYTDKGPVMLN